MATQVPAFVSAASANALISDLRPTSLSSPALTHLNLLLDELLNSLLDSSQSLNPHDLRINGIPGVFTGDDGQGGSTGLRALGRSAVGEAELELRSWYDSHPSAVRGDSGKGFPPSGRGNGTMRGGSFPLAEAVDVMRIKIVTFSTLAPQSPHSKYVEERMLLKWKSAGGDVSDETLSPAGLWITAILEHVCEHILAQLSRVVSRDSSIAVAGAQDLYVALCEDESVWGFFKRMQVKEQLEQAIRSGTRKRIAPPRLDEHRDSPASSVPSLHSTSNPPIGASRNASIDTAPGRRTPALSSSDARPSTDQSSIMNKSASMRRAFMGSSSSSGHASAHERSPSVLSANTRSMLGAFNDEVDRGGSPQDDEDEFDALVRSGETMKVSLTPSRLKSFEAMNNTRKPVSTPPQISPQKPRIQPPQSKDLSPLLPHSVLPGTSDLKALMSMNRSTSTQKLVPRAATIDEKEEEEDIRKRNAASSRGRQESLMEILSSDPPLKPGEEPLPRSSGSIRRTVPAVVLGTPPPPAPPSITEPLKKTSPSLNRPERSVFDDEKAFKTRPKTAAQEMADFLNTAPPPSSNDASSFVSSATVPAKKTGFRGFMAKVTGNKNKDQPGLSTSHSTTQLNKVAPSIPRRQQSSMSVGGQQPSNKYPEQPPAVPIQPLARQDSNRDRNLALGALGLGGVTAATAALISRKSDQEPTIISAAESSKTPPSEAVPLPKQLNSVNLAGGQVLEDEHIGPDGVDLIEPKGVTSLPVAAPISGDLGGTKHEHPVSEVASFQTANEETSEQPVITDNDTTTPTLTGATTTTLPSAPPIPTEPLPPSITLTDLVPLRNLLNHATSARECRLLLNAILTQYGVPSSTEPLDTPSSETRVAAWLLAGRDPGAPINFESPLHLTSGAVKADEMDGEKDGGAGPKGLEEVGDTPSSSIFSKGTEDQIMTPTHSMGMGKEEHGDSLQEGVKVNGHVGGRTSVETEEH